MPVPISFCITELDPGGAERALVRLVLGLDRRRWTPRVVCLGPDAELVGVLRNGGVEVTCLNVTSKRDFGSVFRLRRELKRTQPQLLQTFLFHANVVGRIAAKLARVPHVVSGIRVAERRSPWLLRIDRWTEFLVDRHVCVSQSVADYSVTDGGLNSTKVMAINNGVDGTEIANASPADLTQFGVPSDATVALFVGRLAPQKAPDVLLKSMQQVVRVHPQTHLLVVGDGALAGPMRELTRSLSLDENVHFVGRQSDVAGLMKAADMFVLPSLWEGLPNVVLEAMAAGLPVVATAVDGTCEVVQHEQNGLLVPPGVVDELASTICRVLNDRQAAQQMASAAQVHVTEHFTWERCVASYSQLYEELIKS